MKRRWVAMRRQSQMRPKPWKQSRLASSSMSGKILTALQSRLPLTTAVTPVLGRASISSVTSNSLQKSGLNHQLRPQACHPVRTHRTPTPVAAVPVPGLRDFDHSSRMRRMVPLCAALLLLTWGYMLFPLQLSLVSRVSTGKCEWLLLPLNMS